MLPAIFQDVSDRCVTPFDPQRSRVGIAFDLPDGTVVRYALTAKHARDLARVLLTYSNLPASTQSRMSELNPSKPRSVPSGAENV
jgi:hypothetical protein